MRKILVFVAAVLVFVSCAGFQPSLDGLKPPLIRICAMDPLTMEVVACGRGFVSDDTTDILTAAHVVSPFHKIVLVGDKTDGDDGISVLDNPVVIADRGVDMALIHESLPAESSLPLCRPVFGEFEEVVVWGKEGPIRGRATGLDRAQAWMFPPVKRGDSGSPIVSIERECIIGLISSVFYYRRRDGQHDDHHTIGVSSNALLWLIDKAEFVYGEQARKGLSDAGKDTELPDAGE